MCLEIFAAWAQLGLIFAVQGVVHINLSQHNSSWLFAWSELLAVRLAGTMKRVYPNQVRLQAKNDSNSQNSQNSQNCSDS